MGKLSTVPALIDAEREVVMRCATQIGDRWVCDFCGQGMDRSSLRIESHRETCVLTVITEDVAGELQGRIEELEDRLFGSRTAKLEGELDNLRTAVRSAIRTLENP